MPVVVIGKSGLLESFKCLSIYRLHITQLPHRSSADDLHQLQPHRFLCHASHYMYPDQGGATPANMSVAPMLTNMPSIDATRHLDNPTTLALSRTTTSEIPPSQVFVLGQPSDGTIAQRRKLTRAIRSVPSLAQRQLKSHHSGILRFERDRSCSVERSIEGSAISSRRTQHRVKTAKKRACRRVRSRADLKNGRVLAKKASTIGSEMVFFGKFQANPQSGLLGCVPS